MSHVPITAIAMTLNEESNIEYCLRSVRPWCDQVIVVDMMSDDRTPEIAGRYADIVIPHERIAAFDAARARGIEAATGDWIFVIDADEVVPFAMSEWIRSFAESDPAYDVVRVHRMNIHLGRRLVASPRTSSAPRFFRKGAIEISGQLHQGIRAMAGSRVLTMPRKEAHTSIWHFATLDVDTLTAKMNRYTSIEARQATERGLRPPKPRHLFSAAARWLWQYVRAGGYRDGTAGLIIALNRAYYRYLTMAKRWDESRLPTRQAQYDAARERLLGRYRDGGAPRPQG
jgi:glycosyltransferase involved in cell wall biosynthesis